jgi:hypothetical protein
MCDRHARARLFSKQALEDERQMCKTGYMENDLEWDEDQVYPLSSDSSITESSEGEEPVAAETPQATVKKESRSAEGTAAVQASTQSAQVQALHDNVVRVYGRAGGPSNYLPLSARLPIGFCSSRAIELDPHKDCHRH